MVAALLPVVAAEPEQGMVAVMVDLELEDPDLVAAEVGMAGMAGEPRILVVRHLVGFLAVMVVPPVMVVVEALGQVAGAVSC